MKARMAWPVAAALALHAATASAQSAGWYVEEIPATAGEYQGYPSIDVAVDAAGGTHLAVFRNAGLAYMYRATPADAWTTEEIGAPDGYHPSIALDPQGRPHVVWRDSQWNLVHVARGADGSWTRTIVAQGAGTGTVAVDARGVAHLAYSMGRIEGYYAIRYATVEAGAVTTDEEIGIGWYASIAVDGGGVPRVAWSAATYGDYVANPGVFYAVRGPAGWEVSQVSTTDYLAAAYVALDPAGTPWVYARGGSQSLLSTLGDAGWIPGPYVYSNWIMMTGRLLAIDAQGRIHNAYIDHDYYAHHRVFANGAWTDSWLGRGEYTIALALDASGSPRVAYYRNAWDVGDLHFELATPDPVPPTTTATVSGTPGNAPWYVSPVVVTLSAMDAGSAVAELRYSVDGGPQVVVPGPSATIPLAADGEHVIAYQAVDRAQNVEDARTLSVSIDATPPAVELAPSPAVLWPPRGQLVPVTLPGSASDAGSGVASVSLTVVDEYGTHGATAAAFGSVVQLEASRLASDPDGRVYTATATVTDVAGNTGTATATVTVPHSL